MKSNIKKFYFKKNDKKTLDIFFMILKINIKKKKKKLKIGLFKKNSKINVIFFWKNKAYK
jgi:hypothetical protein